MFGRRPVAHQQMRSGERAWGAFAGRRDRGDCEREDERFAGRARRLRGVGVENELHAFGFERALQFGGDFVILARNDLRAVLNHGDLRAEAAEHLPEFQADVAAAEND